MSEVSPLTESFLDKQAQLRHESRWLRQQRIESLKAFNKLPAPSWHKDNLPPFNFNCLSLPDFPSEEHVLQSRDKSYSFTEQSIKVIFKGDRLELLEIPQEFLHQGVIITDMQTALLERADLVEQYLNRNSETRQAFDKKFEFLNTALWTNGLFVFVPRNITTLPPVYCEFIEKEKSKVSASLYLRNLVIVDENSELHLSFFRDLNGLETTELEKEKNKSLLHSFSLDMYSGKCSKIKCAFQEYSQSQKGGGYPYNHTQIRLHGDEMSKNQIVTAQFSDTSGIFSVSAWNNKDFSETHHSGISLVNASFQRKTLVQQYQLARETKGEMNYKTLLANASKSDLTGLIYVPELGRGSVSSLEETILFQGDVSRVTALPALDIQTSNVDVSHAASVFRLKEEDLFYLCSRGIKENQARELLIDGFFSEIIETPTVYPVQDKWIENLHNKIQLNL